MNICYITENSYPYIISKNSNWLNTFIMYFPDYTLSAFSIGSREMDKGNYIYKTPNNMINIVDVFLDTPLKSKLHHYNKTFINSDCERELLLNHFSGTNSNWVEIFKFLETLNQNKIKDFFNSKCFYNIVRAIYNQSYSNEDYNDFLWTMRTMYIYQFHILKSNIPKTDIYHSISGGYAGIFGAICSYKTQKPLILTEHNIYIKEKEYEILNNSSTKTYAKKLWINYYKSMINCAYSFAIKVISPFEYSRNIHIELGVNPEKTMLIHTGINVFKFKNLSLQEEGNDIVIGSSSRIVPTKDIFTTIKSFEIAKKKVPNLKLILVSPTNENEVYFNYIKKYIKDKKLNNIIFTGNVNEDKYIEFLHTLDIFINTSIKEDEPLSLLEAMACKTPVICTNIGCIKEIVYGNSDKFGAAGFVAPVMNHIKIADCIIELATKKSLRDNMGDFAYKRIFKFYSFKNMSNSYRNLYESQSKK